MDSIEKARTKIQRQDGDRHPTRPDLVWVSSATGGKGDWRKDKGAKKDDNQAPSNKQSSKSDEDKASKFSDEDLKKVLDDDNASDAAKEKAKEILEQRKSKNNDQDGSSKEDKGSDNEPKKSANTPSATSKSSEDSTPRKEERKPSSASYSPVSSALPRNLEELEKYEDEGHWYEDKNHPAIKRVFRLDTVSGRIAYDAFVDRKKRAEPDYKPILKRLSKINVKYLGFLSGDGNGNFLVSAGGAGIGKSYGFKLVAARLNKVFYDSQIHKPGEGDYDIFEAPNPGSAKKLMKILKEHNGKIIMFDDTDAILTQKQYAAIMKKATIDTQDRILSDPDDPSNNFKFTGRIVVMTNKSVGDVAAESEDAKAIMSRAATIDINVTKNEQLEVMKKRIHGMKFDKLPRLIDEDEDRKERDDVMAFIEKNIDKIDPANFTPRLIGNVIKAKREAELSMDLYKNAENDDEKESIREDFGIDEDMVNDPNFWYDNAEEALSKANEDEIGTKKKEVKTTPQRPKFEWSRAYDDGVFYEENDITKASDKFYESIPMSLDEAKRLLLEDE
nr:MAG TPA: ATPase [Caudoviricetes sp.]